MYSVFLVEDEVLIRDGIREIIDWERYGFVFSGEASDGELAWPQIQKLKPDIVMTDIKMPFMDGLMLSRLIKKELPQTMVIILSGYDEFSYAKQALEIGVSQYLLKPLSKDQLIEVLIEIKSRKDKEREQEQYLARFHNEVQEYLTTSRRGFFDALVSGKQSVSMLLERADKLHINISAEEYNVIFFLMQETSMQSGYSARLADWQEELCAQFSEDENLVMFSIGVDAIVFLVMADKGEAESKTVDYVQQIEKLCEPLKGLVNWSYEVGTPIRRLSSVADCYRETRKKMFGRNIGGNITTAPSALDFDPNDMRAGQMDQRAMDKFLTSGLLEDIPCFVRDYLSSAGETAAKSLLFRQYIALNIQINVNAFLERQAQHAARAAEIRTQSPSVKQLSTWNGTVDYIEKLLAYALTLRDRTAKNRYAAMLEKAVAYMEEHFADADISLNQVAQVVNIRSTHFSAVFSQQMGKTFVEYLTELRMERARTLLRCTDKSSGDIAFEVGYNDPHYFSFLFKKVNGCSPRAYRAGRNGSYEIR
ncbi:MAG: response regulator [Eubacteriales bacterium]|nr:response regulator [Eubacteriales bacterium]